MRVEPRAEHLMREVDLKHKSEIIDRLYDVALDPALVKWGLFNG